MRTALAERDPEHLRHIVAVKNCDSDSGSHFDNNDGTKKPENRHKVLGYMAIATWYPSYFPKSPVSQLYIASIGSIPGAHVGSALINYARGLAREWGLQVIRLECAGGGKLEALYARQGFRRATAEEAEGYQAEQQLMILPVDGDSSPE
ncbi:hypothetical protein BOTBODRAFT_30558 [Botryobasidium botryosum FD-172 SS1]|uniref:N-acetyltransferase domain-containing protein n=1 Tax=Botryobasidium botryosum (strain FD-172 SS1) TaxID=930990 RepID=A0A067MLK2_BOTB1|nr:hypothetical protein BOTBODRAFT_30558 [Botryobasidium botryosum FD-172 SS1]